MLDLEVREPLHVVERLTGRAQHADAVHVAAVGIRAQVQRGELGRLREHARMEGLLREQVVARIVGAWHQVDRDGGTDGREELVE